MTEWEKIGTLFVKGEKVRVGGHQPIDGSMVWVDDIGWLKDDGTLETADCTESYVTHWQPLPPPPEPKP